MDASQGTTLEQAFNLANTDLELEGLAPVVAGIELFSVRQRAPVMHGEGVALRQKHPFTAVRARTEASWTCRILTFFGKSLPLPGLVV